MNDLAVSGEYMQAGEADVISDGREAWGRIKTGVKMLREDWLKVGAALSKGRAENPSNQAFGKWCDDNGFGDIDRRVRADCLWLVEHEAVVPSGDNAIGYESPKAIRSAYRKLTRQPKDETENKKAESKKPKTSAGRVLSAIKDLSSVVATGESFWQSATDKQRACLRQEIKHAHIFINQLNEAIQHESD